MYIAFKWLVGLALAMWIAMCSIDIYIKNIEAIALKKGNSLELAYRNSSISPPKEKEVPVQISNLNHNFTQQDSAALHYIMFFAGVLAVTVFNKKSEIFSYTRNQVEKIDIKAIIIEIKKNWKRASILMSYFIKKYITIFWTNLSFFISRIRNKELNLKTETIENIKLSNSLLLKKIKEIVEERKRLGQLLIATVNENRNIKLQYRLETMAKNRLVRHIEDSQKKIKENRSKYINYQHLYLVTHQENTFLKARVHKLTKDKENVEKDLINLISKVYKTKNNELKAFCSRFIVRTRENVFNSDISMEVRKFLERSRMSSSHSDGDTEKVKDWLPPFTMEITESNPDATFVPLASDAPRLKGLPGEYIWTIKDKDGIIEKLYEYDFESDLDNGDTIRRIREYSVYHDKDCLLDFSSLRNVDAENSNSTELHLYPARERFLTGSDAFQRFLQNNKNVVPPSRSATSTTRSLLCV